MTNAGKRMLNWRRDLPVTRVALGLLGKDGYRAGETAAFLLTQPFLHAARKLCARDLGRELTKEMVASRITKHEEIDNMKAENPRAYEHGKLLKAELVQALRGAGIGPAQ